MPTDNSVILLCLVVAVMTGVLVGWVLRRSSARELRSALSTRDRELAEAISKIEELEPRSTLLADRLQESHREKESGMDLLRQRILFLESELGKISQEKGLAVEQLRDRVEELEPMVSRLGELAAKYQELNDRHQWLVNEKDSEIERLRARVRELEPLGGVLAERDAHTRDLERTLFRATEEREAEIRRLRVRIGELESLEGAFQEHASPDVSHEENDDLKLIHGVGPVLEKKLNALGVLTFRDVAGWTEKDIDRIDDQLVHFQGRIRREGWVSSAKDEHFKKYGEHL